MRIWLLEFARQHPGAAQLDGLDISLDQVPNKQWLPFNVSFYLYDIYDNPPDDLVERYDIIHVRHLTLVIKDNGPTMVIRNLLKMLSRFVYIHHSQAIATAGERIYHPPLRNEN